MLFIAFFKKVTYKSEIWLHGDFTYSSSVIPHESIHATSDYIKSKFEIVI